MHSNIRFVNLYRPIFDLNPCGDSDDIKYQSRDFRPVAFPHRSLAFIRPIA
jgi:hypothetical protein